jgi:hypothetical protein
VDARTLLPLGALPTAAGLRPIRRALEHDRPRAHPSRRDTRRQTADHIGEDGQPQRRLLLLVLAAVTVDKA